MDLTTEYMGLKLRSPLVPSASPLSRNLDTIRRLEDAGAGAVVLGSLFEEQIAHDAEQLEHYLHYGADRFAESLSYYPEDGDYHLGPEEYLEHVRRVKQAVGIPVIASLNGVSAGGWTRYARKIQQAGADAIELNIYYLPTNPRVDAGQIESVYLDVLRGVKNAVSIPVAMKLSPFFTALANLVTRLDEGGAEAFVLFNRFYQPDIDIEQLDVRPDITLTRSADGLLALRWVALLYGRIGASLAATGGVHTGRDAAKMILAGADVAMLCSALLIHGPAHLAVVRDGLEQVMQAGEYESVHQMRGVLSQQHCPEPGVFERANYVKGLERFGQTATFE